MNKTIFTLSIIVIITSHLFAFNFMFEKNEIKISKPKYQKISMQFAQMEPIKPKINKEQVIKEVLAKEVFIKPIKKNAIKKLQKEKKIVKKIQKKKILKKVLKKKILKKVLKKKVITKKLLKAPINKVKKAAIKETAKSLKEYKIFKNDYMNKLRSAIDKNKKYPRISRKLKEQGQVTIFFRILKNGELTNVKIVKKSRKKRLNNAALNAVLLTKIFDVFPKEFSNKEYMDITLPINFKLL